MQTVLSFYNGLSGRVVPLLIIQIPAAIAKAAGSSILPAYAATLIAFAALFVAGSAFAMVRMWPNVRGLPLLVLMLGFPAAIAGATPSAHDLLYWLPGIACYVPPGLVTILILGECVHAIDRERPFSIVMTAWATVGGFLAATCNEFTAVWLVWILGASFFTRRFFNQKPQFGHHLLIAAAKGEPASREITGLGKRRDLPCLLLFCIFLAPVDHRRASCRSRAERSVDIDRLRSHALRFASRQGLSAAASPEARARWRIHFIRQTGLAAAADGNHRHLALFQHDRLPHPQANSDIRPVLAGGRRARSAARIRPRQSDQRAEASLEAIHTH